MNSEPRSTSSLTMAQVLALWWPLAGSWVLMGIELPIVSAAMARLSDPEVHLAAYGGVVFPISLIIEAPVIMLLAASTALSADWQSYRFLRRFMAYMAGVLTCVHILVAFTPLYDVVVGPLLGVPEVVREPARWGLMVMTPWTAAIAVRRFQQGVLIRDGRTRPIGLGTALRLVVSLSILCLGLIWQTIPGIVVGTTAVAAGVVTEAVFIQRQVQRSLAALRREQGAADVLTYRRLVPFYVPLAMTSLLALLGLPLGSAALSRMPGALDSLAIWPLMAGLSFTLRSVGLAFQEVVVSLVGQPGAAPVLRRFAIRLGMMTSLALLTIAASPLAFHWFGTVGGLAPHLAELGSRAIWLAVLLPGMSAIESFFQGVLVHRHQTRCITEAVVVYLFTSGSILAAGVFYGQVTGLYFGVAAVSGGLLIQNLWLWSRSTRALRGT